LPGKPDLVFPKYRVALFVHGCFWHRHENCSKASTPKSRVGYWERKFATNVHRDAQTYEALRKLGWTVAILWECETKRPQKLDERLAEIFKH
jgi:DNA mismatch endonuclease (patch repair protein)